MYVHVNIQINDFKFNQFDFELPVNFKNKKILSINVYVVLLPVQGLVLMQIFRYGLL